jgi:hypothetical protein
MRETGKGFGLQTDGNAMYGIAILAERLALAVGLTGQYWGFAFLFAYIAAGEGIDAAVDAPYVRMVRAITAARWASGVEARPTFEQLKDFMDVEVPTDNDGNLDYKKQRNDIRRLNRELKRDHRQFERAIQSAEAGFMNLFLQVNAGGVAFLRLADGSRVEMTPENFAKKLASLDVNRTLCDGPMGNGGVDLGDLLKPSLPTEGLEDKELKKAERQNRRIERRNDRISHRYYQRALVQPDDLIAALVVEQSQ